VNEVPTHLLRRAERVLFEGKKRGEALASDLFALLLHHHLSPFFQDEGERERKRWTGTKTTLTGTA